MDISDRLPPQAVEVEQAVLGAMLTYSEARHIGAREILDPAVFYDRRHILIWRAILRAEEEGDGELDYNTVADELSRVGQLDEVGGSLYVADLAIRSSGWHVTERHIGILKEKFRRRRLIEETAAAAQQAYDESVPLDQLLDRVDERLLSLADRPVQTDGFLPAEDLVSQVVSDAEAAQARGGNLAGLDTGLRDLNFWTGGLEPGLYICAGRPSEGKTALVLRIARHVAGEGHPVALFSLEMNGLSVMRRLVSQECRLNLRKLRLGQLTQDEWISLARTAGTLAALPLHIHERTDLTVTATRSLSRQLKQRCNLGLVVVDYIQLLAADGGDTREQEVARISRGLKALSHELSVPVLAVSQLSRTIEARTKKRPQLSDLRESGQLEQDADAVLFIYHGHKMGLKGPNGESLEGTAEIILGKQRNGPVASFPVAWDEGCARFDDLAPEWLCADEAGTYPRHDNE